MSEKVTTTSDKQEATTPDDRKETTLAGMVIAPREFPADKPFTIGLSGYIMDAWTDRDEAGGISVKVSCQYYGIEQWQRDGYGIILTQLHSQQALSNEKVGNLLFGTREEGIMRIEELVDNTLEKLSPV